MKICIPSKARRREQMTTLDLLANIPRKDKIVYVEPQDMEKYSDLINEVCLVSIKENERKVGYSRNFIVNHSLKRRGHQRILMLDDNIQEFAVLKDNKLVTLNPSEIPSFLEEVDNIMDEQDVGMLTISFKPSNWYSQVDFKYNTRAWAFFLIDNERTKGVNFDPYCLLFEDYDYVAQLISKGIKTGCSYRYSFYKEMGKSKGGANTYAKTHTVSKLMCGYMQKKWGKENIKIFYNERHNIFEPQFRWSKISR